MRWVDDPKNTFFEFESAVSFKKLTQKMKSQQTFGLSYFDRALEQFIQTVRGQNNKILKSINWDVETCRNKLKE